VLIIRKRIGILIDGSKELIWVINNPVKKIVTPLKNELEETPIETSSISSDKLFFRLSLIFLPACPFVC